MSAPGSLRMLIDDHHVEIEMVGGATHRMPLGPRTLVAGPLSDGDPPLPASLTNALGLVADHVDDLLIEAPGLAEASSVTLVGFHPLVVARVELGRDDVPGDYVLTREAADEVFRTVALESVDERRHNPGLPTSEVESIVGTCCVILGVMRRLDLTGVHVDVGASAGTEQPA